MPDILFRDSRHFRHSREGGTSEAPNSRRLAQRVSANGANNPKHRLSWIPTYVIPAQAGIQKSLIGQIPALASLV
jgi:hypothetical protein